MDLSIDEVSMDIMTGLAIVSPTLPPFLIESKLGTVSYNPQRVMRQLDTINQLSISEEKWATRTLFLLNLHFLVKEKSI